MRRHIIIHDESNPDDPNTWRIDSIGKADTDTGKSLHNIVDPTGFIIEAFNSKRDAEIWLRRARQTYRAKDSKWTGTYTARTREGKKIEFTATIEAPDAYAAGDKLKAMAAKKYGDDLYYPVIRFNRAERRLPSGSIGQRIAAAAGPEEDSKS